MIEYKGTPLFGEGSSVSHTSEFFAIAGTVLFWLLFLIFSFVIKPQPKKPEYKEVQIVLSSTPLVQKSEAAPAEAASAGSASSEPVVAEVVETPAPEPTPKSEVLPVKESPNPVETPKPKAQTQPKKEAAKTQPAATPIYKSNEELLAEQLNNKRTRNDNYDPWANETEEEIQQDENRRVVKNQNTMEGKAADAAANGSGDTIKSEQRENKSNDIITQGDMLNAIRDTKETGHYDIGLGNGLESSNGIENTSIKWTDGKGIRSVFNFDTELSPEAKKSMEVSNPLPFTISFSVDSDGNVMATTIVIKNEFMLSEPIKKEMREKISSWKFGKGSGISKAQFDWILNPGN